MDCKLSVLIPSLTSRAESFLKLYDEINRQVGDLPVQILSKSDNGEMSIGEKRNWLLERAKGEYVAFFDDDDLPSRTYVSSIMEGIEKGVDCVSLRGVITWDGDNPEIFEHSIRYAEWKTNDTGFPKYERCVNHLNAIKSSIAKQFKFPEINFGEDRAWSEAIKASGLIKTEHYVDRVLYHYLFKPNK